MLNIQLVSCISVLLVITFFFGNCVSSSRTPVHESKINSISNSVIKSDKAQEIEDETRFPIIEIWKEIDGSVAIRGKSLFFRMYDDGAVEFEYLLKKEDGSGKPRFTYSIEKVPPTKIGEVEFVEIKSLLVDLTKSKEIKREYKYVGLNLDVFAKLTIVLKENGTAKKEIVINDSELDVINKSLEKNFPKLLVNFIKKIHLIRVNLQDKQKNQE